MSKSYTLAGLGMAAALCISLLSASVAHAQQIFISSDTTIDTDVSGNDVFVGKDDLNGFNTLGGTITLTVAAPANITGFGTQVVPEGDTYFGVLAYGSHKTDVAGGNVSTVHNYDNSSIDVSDGMVDSIFLHNTGTANVGGGYVKSVSGDEFTTLNVFGGTVVTATSAYFGHINVTGGTVFTNITTGASTTTIRSGRVDNAYGYDGGVTLILGGQVRDIYGYDDSTFGIAGGTIGTNSIRLFEDSKLNITGKNLSLALLGMSIDGNGLFTKYGLSGTLQDGQSLEGVLLYDYEGGLSVGDPTLGASNTGNLRFFPIASAAPEPNSLGLFVLLLPFLGLTMRRCVR